MQYRTFPRTGWKIAEIGYGTWGMAGWTGSDDAESLKAMERALTLGCNFFRYRLGIRRRPQRATLGRLLAGWKGEHVYVATKVPPKNGRWPARADYRLDDVFPAEHIKEMTHKSLENLRLDCVDLQQLHVWTDEWAADERWQRPSRTSSVRAPSRPSASASIAGSRPTSSARCERGSSTASRSYTTSSTRTQRTSCSRCARN